MGLFRSISKHNLTFQEFFEAIKGIIPTITYPLLFRSGYPSLAASMLAYRTGYHAVEGYPVQNAIGYPAIAWYPLLYRSGYHAVEGYPVRNAI